MTEPHPPMSSEVPQNLLLTIRFGAATLILFGMSLALNLGGLAEWMEYKPEEDNFHQLLGGGLAIIGLYQFFVVPYVLKKAREKQAAKQTEQQY